MCSERSKPCTTGALKETGRFEERMARLLSFEWLKVSPFCRVRTQPTATARAPDARKARQGGPPCAGLPRQRGEAHHVDLPCLA